MLFDCLLKQRLRYAERLVRLLRECSLKTLSRSLLDKETDIARGVPLGHLGKAVVVDTVVGTLVDFELKQLAAHPRVGQPDIIHLVHASFAHDGRVDCVDAVSRGDDIDSFLGAVVEPRQKLSHLVAAVVGPLRGAVGHKRVKFFKTQQHPGLLLGGHLLTPGKEVSDHTLRAVDIDAPEVARVDESVQQPALLGQFARDECFSVAGRPPQQDAVGRSDEKLLGKVGIAHYRDEIAVELCLQFLHSGHILEPVAIDPHNLHVGLSVIIAAARSQGLDVPEISPDAMEFLTRLHYPGNIRQLKNMVERAVLIGGPRLVKDDFATLADMREEGRVMQPSGTLDDKEKEAIQQALEQAEGNLTQASRILGITRQTLYRRMEKHGINRQ